MPLRLDVPYLPPPIAGSIHELANQLLAYGIRLQILLRNGNPVEIHCTPPPSRRGVAASTC